MTEFDYSYSIVIPVYNGEPTLPDTLNSVMQFNSEAVEVIIVDDGSTDNTVKIAQDAGAKVISLKENRGPAAARNHGANEAQHDIIVFTDSDVLVSKSLLQQLDSHFKQSGADCVQGVFSSVCPFANFCSQYKNLYNRFVLSTLPDWIDTTYTSLTAVKKYAFDRSGGFDDKIRGASVEDRTLGRNLINSGYKIWLARDIEVLHNKQLTLWGFIRNQFRRSRDLAKLLLRNREERKDQTAPTIDHTGRFGTNSLSAMVRIPIIYAAILFSGVLLFTQNINWLLVIATLLVAFAYLVDSFMKYLFRYKGFLFVLKAFVLNMIDAGVSGLGIGTGIVEYVIFGKKY